MSAHQFDDCFVIFRVERGRVSCRSGAHGDLNAHNILLRNDDEVFLIDFDKARLRRGGGDADAAVLGERLQRSPGMWADANLARLRRSLDALEDGRRERRFDDTQWQCLLTAWFHFQ